MPDTSMRLRLPARSHIVRVDESDPLPWYYKPLVGRLYQERLQMALDLLGPGPFDRVLEAGYGSGILLPTLATRARELFAMDLHRQARTVQRMLAQEQSQAELSVGDVCALSYAGATFDAVVCISTLEHLHGEALDRTVGEFRRVLRPGGLAVVGVPASGWIMDVLFRAIGFAEIGEHHVSAHDDIATALGRHFRIDGERHMPGFLPGSLALYTVFRGRV
jgi:SAM-dependent methyltransferase